MPHTSVARLCSCRVPAALGPNPLTIRLWSGVSGESRGMSLRLVPQASRVDGNEQGNSAANVCADLFGWTVKGSRLNFSSVSHPRIFIVALLWSLNVING